MKEKANGPCYRETFKFRICKYGEHRKSIGAISSQAGTICWISANGPILFH